VPVVAHSERATGAIALQKGLHRLTLHYGFMEEPDIPADLAGVLPSMGIRAHASELLYVLGRETFVATHRGRMGAVWEGLFAVLSRNAKNATDYFRLPPEQVVEVGAQIDL